MDEHFIDTTTPDEPTFVHHDGSFDIYDTRRILPELGELDIHGTHIEPTYNRHNARPVTVSNNPEDFFINMDTTDELIFMYSPDASFDIYDTRRTAPAIHELQLHGEIAPTTLDTHHQENFQECVDIGDLHVHRDTGKMADYHQENFQLDVSIYDLSLHELQDDNNYHLQWPKVRGDQIFVAEGGFSVFKEFGYNTGYVPVEYDLTHTFQVRRPCSILNDLLGVQKDASGNLTGINTNYTSSTNSFVIDDITLSASSFLTGMLATDISDLGIFEQQYANFINGINRYFGIRGADVELVSQSIDGDTNDILSIPEFHTMIMSTDASGNYNLGGNITINHVNKQIKNILSVDLFENRTNKGIADGFMPGDKILLKNGLLVTFELDFGQSNYPAANPPMLDEPYYNDASINAVPNLVKVVVGDVLLFLT